MLGPITTYPNWLKCINSYRNPQYHKNPPKSYEEEVSSSMTGLNDDILLSPLLAKIDVLQHFPKTYIFGSDIDPCLDDYVDFSKKLSEANVPVSMFILDGMPHGYLNLLSNRRICKKWGAASHEAWEFISRKLKEIVY